MTAPELSQIIISLSTLVGVVGSTVVSLRNSKKIEEVHQSTDGKMDELLKLTAHSSFAAGQKDEKENGNGSK